MRLVLNDYVHGERPSMSYSHSGRRRSWQSTTAFYLTVTMSVLSIANSAITAGTDAADAVKTTSPIKHVIILIGENRGFDHTFATYTPAGKGQTISNLLSKGIVNADGTPGPHYALAQQYSVTPQPSYYIGAPKIAKEPNSKTLHPKPQPTTGGAPSG